MLCHLGKQWHVVKIESNFARYQRLKLLKYKFLACEIIREFPFKTNVEAKMELIYISLAYNLMETQLFFTDACFY